MRAKEPCIILTFHTTAAAIAFEKHCDHARLPGRLIPVPTAITAGCGMAWKAKIADIETKEGFLAQVKESGIAIQQIVEMNA